MAIDYFKKFIYTMIRVGDPLYKEYGIETVCKASLTKDGKMVKFEALDQGFNIKYFLEPYFEYLLETGKIKEVDNV